MAEGIGAANLCKMSVIK